MEGIGFRTLLPGLDSHSLNWRLWHFGNGLGAVVHGVAARRRAGRERKGWASACDGALGARPKLLGPVETLLVWARRITVRRGSWILGVACLWKRRSGQDRAGAAPNSRPSGRNAGPLRRRARARRFLSTLRLATRQRRGRRGGIITISGATGGASGSHAGGTKAHSPDKGRVGRGSSGARPHFIVLNGALINRIRGVGVGGQAAPTNVEGLSTAGGSAREAERGDGEPSAVGINRVGLSGETRAGWD